MTGFNVEGYALWGFVATVLLTVVMEGARGFHLSRMALPFMLGTAFTGNRDLAMVLGSGLHLVNGMLYAVVYVLLFEEMGHAGTLWGAAFGLLHGLFLLVLVIPVLPSIHPRMASERSGPTPTRQLEPPGFIGRNYGWRSAAVTLAGHVAYGAVLGAFYRLAG